MNTNPKSLSKTESSFCHIYMRLEQTGEKLQDELEHLFSLGLVCDATFLLSQGEKQQEYLAALQEQGGLVTPRIFPPMLDASASDPNWWKYSESDCARLLERAQKQYASLGLGEMTAVTTYTSGNEFIAACRKLGIRYILGFCAPTVIEDGAWNISHYGSPLSPYFISDEDYRKPEAPGNRPDAVMMASMELRNPLVSLNHWNEGPWCPLNALAVDRWLEPGDQPLPFLQIAEDWLRLTELTGVSRFFTANLQYFFAGKCFDHNRRALEWLADQRNQGRLEVGSLQAWRKRTLPKNGFERQTTYWRGEMMGFHTGHRLGSYSDVIVDENLDHQAVWAYPDPLPRRYYDFQRRWDYPAFEPTGTAPQSEPFDDIQVTSKLLSVDENTRRVEVRVQAEKNRAVSIALWDLLEDASGPFEVTSPSGWQASVLPHPVGSSGVILLEGEATEKEPRLELIVKTGPRKQQTHAHTWGALLEAKTFEFRHCPYTILASQTPERFTVTVRAKGQTEPLRIQSLCGPDYEEWRLPATGLPLIFDGSRLSCWHRIWGVTAADLEIEGVEEVEARLQKQTSQLVAKLAPNVTVPEPGYQLFGNIRNNTSWHCQVAKSAGDQEIRAMNEWFAHQRPDAGKPVIEVHPGIHIPRGSITKALGHQFDKICCEKGYGFEELCADYPQAWDWGVAAWVQWRHLKVRLSGLHEQGGAYTLHLHAFDPEGRDITQRVHLYDGESGDTRPDWDICAVPSWNLPKGLNGRWQLGALCSFRIPSVCLEWKRIGIWISPLEKEKLHDWIAEKGAPGLFSHLWVTRDRA